MKMCLHGYIYRCFSCLRLWRRHNPKVAFFISVLFLGTFGVLMPLTCRDWAYSKYHYISLKSDDQYMQRASSMNVARIALSKQYLAGLKADAVLRHFTNMETNGNVSVAIGIVTVNRNQEGKAIGYLTQVVARIMQVFDADRVFGNKVLFLCDAEPKAHTEADELAKYIPRYRRFEAGADHVEKDTFNKEKADYMFCMRRALSYRPRYVLIIEDDAVPRPELFTVLHHVLNHLVEHRFSAGDYVPNSRPWAYLKLYYPERWQGFSNELRHLSELLGYALVGGLIFLYTCWFLERRHTTHPAYYYVTGCVFTALVVASLGRQYLLELRRVSPSLYSVVGAPDCCSPAILYPRPMAGELAAYLADTTCTATFPLDFAMDSFARTRHYERYLIEPNLVRHIGLVSSIKKTTKKPVEFIY